MSGGRNWLIAALLIFGAIGFELNTPTTSEASVASGYQGVPFGDLAIGREGQLYFVDLQHGQIDAQTANGPRVLISSLRRRAEANKSIPNLTGIFVTANNLWFTAANGIYRATLSGKNIVRLGAAVGATSIFVLEPNTTIFYTTDHGVFERNSVGVTRRVAGGGDLGPSEWTNGKPATEAGELANGFVAISPTRFYFTTTDNLLAVVVNGALWEYRTNNIDFFNGQMTRAENGNVFALCGWSMCKINRSTYKPMFRIPTHAEGTFIAPVAIAVAPNGDFYESFTNQSTPERTGILKMSATGRLLSVVITGGRNI